MNPPKVDLYLFGENHRTTDLDKAFGIIDTRKIGTLALEGIPAGYVSRRKRQCLNKQEAAYREEVVRFKKTLEDMLQVRFLSDDEPMNEGPYEQGSKFQLMLDDLSSSLGQEEAKKQVDLIDTLFNHVVQGGFTLFQMYGHHPGPGMRYLKPAVQRKLRIIGVEDPEFLIASSRSGPGSLFLGTFNKTRELFYRVVKGTLPLLRTPETRDYLEEMASSVGKYELFLDSQGLTVDYGLKDPGASLADKLKSVHITRTHQWLDGPLDSEHGALLVCGVLHVGVAVTHAQSQGKHVEVVYQEKVESSIYA